MKRTFIFLLFALVIMGCSSEDDNSSTNGVITINYGTSFGECVGYCVNKISVTDENITLEKTGWTFEGALPQITQEKEVDSDILEELAEEVDLESFFDLDDVLGCPDCADGGAEWIEIVTEEKTHKVMFDYLGEPEELEEIIASLRELYESFSEENNVIIDKEAYNNTNTIGYQITDISRDEDKLKITIGASGCDAESWIVSLIDSGDIAESNPAQRYLKLNLFNDQACLAHFTKEYEFDISSLQEENTNTILLNIEGWNELITYNY